MFSLKVVLIFLSILSVALCDKKHGHHGHHMYFHEFYYLIFLALKFKIILVIGTIWTFGVVLAKIFAFFKISEYMKKHHNHDEHYEKIIYTNPHDSFGYPGPDIYGKSVDPGAYGSYPSDVSFDHLPPSGTGEVSQVPEYDYVNAGRSVKKESSTIKKYFHLFSNGIKKYNITELVFKEMNIRSLECKRKFVCEIDYRTSHSPILKLAFNLISDPGYEKYKTNVTGTIEECGKIHTNCLDVT